MTDRQTVLKRINVALAILVVLGAVYILLIPLLPEFKYFFIKPEPELALDDQVMVADIKAQNYRTFDQLKFESAFKQNTLVIEKIGVESEIYTSTDPGVLRQGIWHRSKAGSPTLGGNFVLAGHRFLYTSGKNTLYHLDKLVLGDRIIVFWEGRRYIYEVENVLVVPAGATEIEEPTPQSTLTLYTCTPLYTNSKRLVVRAKAIEAGFYENID